MAVTIERDVRERTEGTQRQPEVESEAEEGVVKTHFIT